MTTPKYVVIPENPNVNTTPDLLTIILSFLGAAKLTLAAYGIVIPVELWDNVVNALAAILAAYGIYKNTYGLSTKAKKQKAALEQLDIK